MNFVPLLDPDFGVATMIACDSNVSFPFQPEKNMQRVMIPALSLMVACAASTAFAADIKSGPQIGAPAKYFEVKDVTGPRKGKSICYR
jgi:hypothetical protein